MAEKRQRLPCREHGGYFYRQPQRGRTPVRCGGKNELCSAAINEPVEREPLADQHTQALKRAVSVPERKSQGNASLEKGKKAKELLEAQGWDVTGKAWRDGADNVWANVSAVRGEERINLVWKNGELQDQVYSLWDLDTPSKNGRPHANLPFDPDEIPDAELARALIGVKVKWWNRLGQKEETAIVGKNLKISQEWSGTGDAYPGARVITFVDYESTGYRSFRLDQLIKVG